MRGRGAAAPFISAATLFLLALALLSLQVSFGGSRLVYEFPAYCAIAIAAILGITTLGSRRNVDYFCVGTAVLFVGYISGRALLSPVAYYARADLYAVLAVFVVYGITITALSAARQRARLLAVLLLFAICHVLVSLVQFGIGQNFIFLAALGNVEATSRPSGLHAGPAYLAGLLEVLGIFAVSLACWSRWPKWGKVLMGYLAFVCYAGVALTGSRGGYVSVGVSLFVFAILSLIALRAGGGAVFWKWGALGVLALALAVWLGSSLINESALLSKRVEAVADVDQGRLDLWSAAIQQWHLQPWLGTGSGTYRFYGRQFRAAEMQQDPVEVHNDYLHLLCEYGVVGGVAFALFLCAHLRQAWRNFVRLGPQRLAAGAFPLSDRLALNLGATAAISAYLVHSAVDFNLHIPANALLLAFVFGLVANPGSNPADEPGPAASGLFPRVAVGVVSLMLLVQAVRLWPGEYYAERARLALESEEQTTAIAFANQALRYDSQNPRVFFFLGRSLSALGDAQSGLAERNSKYEQAITQFQRARTLNPLDGNYPLNIATIYDQMGRFAEAEWMYGLARERDPLLESLAAHYRTHLRLWAKAK
ncbi:MAG: O-antigen ligase family protein [Verrucomicrobiota bacterium]|nr:O-antigen ligase family protein [Verrucomicrobiota bacterium]